MSGTWILVVLVKLKFLVLSCVVLSCMVWYSIVFQSIPLRYSSTMGGVVRCCSPLFDIVLHPLCPRTPRLGSSRFRFDSINRHVCLLAWLLAYVVESLESWKLWWNQSRVCGLWRYIRGCGQVGYSTYPELESLRFITNCQSSTREFDNYQKESVGKLRSQVGGEV